MQSLPTVTPKSFRDRQLNAHKLMLLSQIDRVYLELGQLDLALSFAKTADAEPSFGMTMAIITWLAEKQQLERALNIARSLPEQALLTAEERQYYPASTTNRIIRSSALASIIGSAIRQDKLDFAQKLISELADPTIHVVSSIELAEAYLFKQNDPTTANRILKTVKPTTIYQKYVENIQQFTNCAMND